MDETILIVGGGLGGLTAGVALANQGRKVVLFEKETKVGGYATSFTRAGYTFDPALHAVTEGGGGGVFQTLISSLGIDSGVSFVKLNRAFSVRFGKFAFDMPNDPDALYAALADAFPEERVGLARFRQHLESSAGIYGPVLLGHNPGWRSVGAFIPRIPVFLSQTVMPTHDYLGRFIRSGRLKALLFQPAVFLGIPSTEFPVINYMMMTHLLVGKGMYTVNEGGAGLSRALAERFIRQGGEIVTKARVESIIVRKGKACGVRLAGGAVHEARAVIANMGPTALAAMLPPEAFPAPYMRTLKKLRPSLSVVQLHIGLDCPVEQLGIKSHLSIWFPDDDIDSCIRRQRESLIPEGVSITAPSITWTGLDRDRPWISVVGGVSARAWSAFDQDSYCEAKGRCTESILKTLEGLYPGIRSHVVVSDCATPRTFNRYTGNPDGAIMGYDCSIGMHRKIMKVSRIPVRDLFVAGAWTDRLGGFMQSMQAGIDAAYKVMAST
jgi:phytoene dehydrogenase-like protein